MLSDFQSEFSRYRLIAERAMAQVADDALHRIIVPNGNSIAMLVRHMSGNLRSRFTDFLSSDGEKPWRHRDSEFEDRPMTRVELDAEWTAGWQVLDDTLGTLQDSDLERMVSIRGLPLTVHAALTRALAHMASHVGQIVILARLLAHEEWQWISIPKGQSERYNANPDLEKRPR